MNSEHTRAVKDTLKDRFNDMNTSEKEGKERYHSSKLEKTAADYIHENEIRLRSYTMPSQYNYVKLKHSIPEAKAAKYVFEKVKPKTIPQFVKYDAHLLNVNDNESRSKEYVLDYLPSQIRPRTSSMPTQNTYKKPDIRALQRSQFNLNTISVPTDKQFNLMDRETTWDYNKQKSEHLGLDVFFEDEMRTRTGSMPTPSAYCKPRIHHMRRSHQDLFTKPESEMYSVRSFELNTKGKIVRRSDSRSTRSSNSDLSCESLSRKSSITRTEEFQVLVKGLAGVGKTALMQQFLTTQYLGGFDTSCDGETVKTVNVLLNGEETALAFVEDTEDDLDDDASDNVAAYVIVYSCDDRASFDRAVDTLYNLREKQHTEDVIFFVGNKSDLIRSRCVTTGEAKAVAMTYDCKFVETSVVLNVNVDELLVGIVKQLRLRSAKYADDKCPGCASSSKSLLNKIFKKHNISQSCENLYT